MPVTLRDLFENPTDDERTPLLDPESPTLDWHERTAWGGVAYAGQLGNADCVSFRDFGGGDYSGDPIIATANRRALLAMLSDEAKSAGFVEECNLGHGYVTLIFALDVPVRKDDARALVLALRDLADYPILDDDEYSRAEDEARQEHWGSYGHSDAVGACLDIVTAAIEAADDDSRRAAADGDDVTAAHCEALADALATIEGKLLDERHAPDDFRTKFGEAYWTAIHVHGHSAEYIDPSAFSFPCPVADMDWTVETLADIYGVALPVRLSPEESARRIGQLDLSLD